MRILQKVVFGLLVVAGLMGLAWAAGTRVSQATVYSAVSGKEVSAMLTAEGYPPTLGKADDGDPQIKFKVQGKTIYLDFYDCNKTEFCGSLNISTGWALKTKLKAADLNKWNADNRYIRVYTDEANDPFLESDTDLDGGATMNNVKEFVKMYVSQLEDFIAEFKLR